MPEIIKTKVLSQYQNDQLDRNFEIDKHSELVVRKYNWNILY